MNLFLTAITLISAILMIIVILLQQGKGAELGAAFGRGASGGLFTAQGKANFLTRATRWLVTVFLLSSLALGIFLSQTRTDGVLENLQAGGGDDGVAAELLAETDEESAAADGESAAADGGSDEVGSSGVENERTPD